MDDITGIRTLSILLMLLLTRDAACFLCNDDFDCYPNGKCGNDLSCICNPGFRGEQCDRLCGIRCENGATCVMTNLHGGVEEENEFRCECLDGFDGALCQNEKGTTGAFRCDNDSDCSLNGRCAADLTCLCDPGFSGDQCDQPSPSNSKTPPSNSNNDESNDENTVIVAVTLSVVAVVLAAMITVTLYHRDRLGQTQTLHEIPPRSDTSIETTDEMAETPDALEDKEIPPIS